MTESPNKGGRFYRDPVTGVVSDTPPAPIAATEASVPAAAPDKAADIVLPPLRLKGAQAASAPSSNETKED
ncbi:hypothetical protein [Rhizobium sp. 11_C7_N12_5]|uniref:hypothetical protein n=1 Tax=Rhizobium sp. 11_C7_N12_5 TaxID=3240770 RepID=UPI003F231A36